MLTTEHKKRPFLLTWLCTGSVIFGISWIIMFVVLIIFSLQGPLPEGLFPGKAIEYHAAGNGFIVAEILLTAFGLAAVAMMWNLKKTGFYLYSFVKILVYFLPVAMLGNNHLAFFPLAVTSTLIVGYGISFKGIGNK